MVNAGGMAIAWRSFTRTDERGVIHQCAAERECIVIRVSLGMARIEYCSDGYRTVLPVAQLRAE